MVKQNRLLYNRAILDKLKELIENNPHLRFGQLLLITDIVRNNGDYWKDEFYTESKEIWERMCENKHCFADK